MDSCAPSPEYLLLLRGTCFEETLSPQEMQETMSRYTDWMNRLIRERKLHTGQPLANEARVVTGGRRARTAADGPFAGAKKAVGGCPLLTAGDLDEAAALAEDCPLLGYGATAEVRPVLARCATMTGKRENYAQTKNALIGLRWPPSHRLFRCR